MTDEQLLARIDALGKWHQIIEFNEKVKTPGDWNSKIQFELFKQHMPDLKGKRVLDMGANAGGLSFLLHEAGATVVATEPWEKFRKQFRLYLEYKDIDNIELRENDLFSTHELGEFDIIFCLGLVYHFRHPQMVLDYLASIHKGALLISSQTLEGNDFTMKNRRTYDTSATAGDKPLSGWEPTVPLFKRMIRDAGFHEAHCLQDHHVPGFTNSCYMFIPADPDRTCDIEFLARKYM